MSPPTGNQPKELCSSVDELAPKVRKPYTITKQRERWTEEEHKKFLEALKLHGRAWRHIEEHIGTKTAVQIRSHAQKFFSKVTRESAGNGTGSVKPIEIPPPRPKRKPVHPYPRKLGDNSGNGLPVLQKLGSCPSSTQTLSEQENRSPKSVLSPVESDVVGSSSPDASKQCTSVDTVSTVYKLDSFSPTEQENRCQGRPSPAEEKNGTSSLTNASAAVTSVDKSAMEIDHSCLKEDSQIEVSAMSLKLFGRTVHITDSSSTERDFMRSHKSLPSTGDKKQNYTDMNTIPSHESSPLTCNEDCLEDEALDMSTQSVMPKGNETRIDYCGDISSSSNLWPSYGAPPFFYSLPFQQEIINVAQGASAASLPWWSFYSSFPFPSNFSSNFNSPQHPQESGKEALDREEQLEKDSHSVHDISSGRDGGTTEKSFAAVGPDTSQSSCKNESDGSFPPEHIMRSAYRNLSPTSKGFVPYKRCLAETKANQPEIREDEGRQRIRLYL